MGHCVTKGLFKGHEGIAREIDLVWNDEAKMSAFAIWAMKRCAVECFLCYVEMVQFKERAVAMATAQTSAITFDEKIVAPAQRPKFYKHCPRSSIVFNSADLQTEHIAVVELNDVVMKEMGVDVETVVVVENTVSGEQSPNL